MGLLWRSTRIGAVALRAAAIAILLAAPTQFAGGQSIRLKDGRILTGRILRTSGVIDKIDIEVVESGKGASRPILIVDDELRRLFIPKLQIAEVLEQAPEPLVIVRPWQNASSSAATLNSVGPALGITPFDEFGRREYDMQTADGVLSLVQGITELTPRYAKLESLNGPQRNVSWTSSIATSGIPKDVLARILAKAIPQDDPQARLQVVRFYIQAKRFQEASAELKRIIEEFPQMKDLASEGAQLRQLGARALLAEIALRRSAGQHQLSEALLANFPVDDVDGKTLVQVREITAAYEQDDLRIKRIGEALGETIQKIADPDQRGLAAPVGQEIVRELSHNTVDRLAPFAQLLDDPALGAEDKAALAISGWLVGAKLADRNLPVALALVKVRDAVKQYLDEPSAAERAKIFATMRATEAASIERLAAIIAHMKPPRHEASARKAPAGVLEESAPGATEDGDFRYVVQLPPEYDPYRRYPTIVALNGAYNSPEDEIDYWAGARTADGAPRRGHAMRRGYLVLGVQWQKPHQYEYESSAREHVAVLTALRDAMRKFSIDADRVYLAGHDIGGEAAWDVAQAHPDLWAGAVIFVASGGEMYTRHYWENARSLPLYFVAGELDGRRTAANAPIWDKYLKTPGFDATVAEFQGRGHEPFHDEILALFDWMGRKVRVFPPKEFACKTLRPWDNFFWWLECRDFSPANMMHPTEWSSRAARPATIEGRIQNDNRLLARSSSQSTTIWLSPEIVDFSKPIRVTYNQHKVSGDGRVPPNPEVLLEDVRTRGDRQRPFWAKIEAR